MAAAPHRFDFVDRLHARCTASQGDIESSNMDESLLDDDEALLFNVQCIATFVKRQVHVFGKEMVFGESEAIESITKLEFLTPREELMDEDRAFCFISDMLSEAQVPSDLHPLMINGIGWIARSIMEDDINIGSKVLLLTVDITVYDNEMIVQNNILQPGMKKVTMDNVVDCPICLMEILSTPDDLTAVSLPNCSHIFHENCILKWVERSNTCPMCRSLISTTTVV